MLSDVFVKISAYLSSLTGIEGFIGYLVIIVLLLVGYRIVHGRSVNQATSGGTEQKQEHEEEPDKPRNFTAAQLAFFDGKTDPKRNENKPVYLSLNGTVFDVSNGRDFYGPGGPYELFAGHECGAALAKMSFDTSYLDDMKLCETLNFGEKNELDGWIEKFTYYRCYPVMGRLIPDDVLPSPDRIVSMKELSSHNGSGDIPKGYASAPIYLGAGDMVYDVSFGGIDFYGPGCSYNRFAGKNASRALAKMSFEPTDIENSDLTDLTEKEKKILKDWISTFEDRKKYPCVGRLASS